MSTIDTSSLQKARDQLAESLEYCGSDLAKSDERLAFQLRSAAIQAFEYSFELSIKLLTRHLREYESAEIVKNMPYRELIRTGAEHGFIAQPTVWFRYRELRNITSHTYNESKAQEVFVQLDAFLHHVNALIAEFERYATQHKE